MTLHGAVPRKLCDFKNISAIYNEKIITKNLKQHNIKKNLKKINELRVNILYAFKTVYCWAEK